MKRMILDLLNRWAAPISKPAQETPLPRLVALFLAILLASCQLPIPRAGRRMPSDRAAGCQPAPPPSPAPTPRANATQTNAAAESFFGPFFSRENLTLDSGQKAQIAGPLFSSESLQQSRSWSVHPLFFSLRDPETDRSEMDYLYPLATYRRYGPEYRWQFVQLFSFSSARTSQQAPVRRVTIFPIYFRQRSADTNANYTALVPFYGHLKNRLFRDDVKFVLFPFYLETRKKDVVTVNTPYPFFHRRHGPGLDGWQLWPIIGTERKTPADATNQWGDAILEPGHRDFFLFWPLYFNNQTDIGSTNAGRQRVILPFYVRQTSPARDLAIYGFPLGYTKIIDREQQYRERAFPWPIIDFARGPGKTANRVWPFFSQAKTPTLESDFYLWPLYKFNAARSEPLDRRRTRILLFLYSDLTEKNTETGTAFRRTDLWPFFTARQDHQGKRRLQLFAPIEPILPNNKAIERNDSPLWSFWVSESDPRAGRSSQSLLWNLYRHERAPGSRKVSLLFGLFQYQSTLEGKRWRLFYIPFGHASRPSAALGAKPAMRSKIS